MSNSFREILYSLVLSLSVSFITYFVFLKKSDMEEQMKVRFMLTGFSTITLIFYAIFSFTVLKCDSTSVMSVKEYSTDIFSINCSDIGNYPFVLGYDNDGNETIYYFNIVDKGNVLIEKVK